MAACPIYGALVAFTLSANFLPAWPCFFLLACPVCLPAWPCSGPFAYPLGPALPACLALHTAALALLCLPAWPCTGPALPACSALLRPWFACLLGPAPALLCLPAQPCSGLGSLACLALLRPCSLCLLALACSAPALFLIALVSLPC